MRSWPCFIKDKKTVSSSIKLDRTAVANHMASTGVVTVYANGNDVIDLATVYSENN